MNKLKSLLMLSCIILCGYSLYAQRNYVNKDWTRNFGSVGQIDRTASVVDDNLNLYVVGNTLNSDGTTDVLQTNTSRMVLFYGRLLIMVKEMETIMEFN